MNPTSSELEAAVRQLAAGELVGLPTETVYGLAADASQDDAVAKIFRLKGRPTGHPLIVHLHCAEQLREWACEIPQEARDLARAFWPGPLTIILPRASTVSTAVTGGHPTVGLRVPAHPVAQALLQRFGQSHSGALAAPSANRFGRVSPTTAAHVRAEFGDELDLVLDGGPCQVGIESTIVDCSHGAPSILRPGQISREAIEAQIGAIASQPGPTVAPGTLSAHYAVGVPTRMLQRGESLPLDQGRVGWLGFDLRPELPPSCVVERLSADARSFAQGLYAALRRLEAAQVQAIYLQYLPESSAWQGVRDRLTRACAAYRRT